MHKTTKYSGRLRSSKIEINIKATSIRVRLTLGKAEEQVPIQTQSTPAISLAVISTLMIQANEVGP